MATVPEDPNGNMELEAIGFEYGLCKIIDLTTGVKEIDFDFIPGQGVHVLRITDNGTADRASITHVFGGNGPPGSNNEDDPNLVTAAIKFDGTENRELIGFQGRWKNTGLTGLGLIFKDPECSIIDSVTGEEITLEEEEEVVEPETEEDTESIDEPNEGEAIQDETED